MKFRAILLAGIFWPALAFAQGAPVAPVVVNGNSAGGGYTYCQVGTVGTGTCKLPVDSTATFTPPTATKVSSSALAANQVVVAGAGTFYSFDVSADSTLSGAAWWVMVYDATSAPADGTVTPAKCYALPSGTTSIFAAFPNGITFGTGITIGVSTTGCFTKTASTHAFISGDYK